MIKEINVEEASTVLNEYFADELGNKLVKGIYDYYFGYYADNKLIGVLAISKIYDRIEINYVVVTNLYRNKGVASKLLNYIIQEYDYSNITLEVNEKNKPAINLYKKFGFSSVSIRKNYYKDADAILMMRSR